MAKSTTKGTSPAHYPYPNCKPPPPSPTMASCSSSSHPSSHLYRDDRSWSTTSLELMKKRSLLSRLLLSSQKEGLLPLWEGASLSSSSSPPVLLTLPRMFLNLPHPAHMLDSTTMREGDSSWATTPDPSPHPPIMILGWRGTSFQPSLQQLTPIRSFGTILPFHTVPTSPPHVMDPLSTEPLPHQATYRSSPGTVLSRTQSGHQSLYQSSRHPSRNPSLVPSHPRCTVYWRNIDKQRLTPPCLWSIQEINHDARRYSINACRETVEHEASEASDTVTKGLPKAEYINSIHEPSPKPPVQATNPNPPSDDAVWRHQILWRNSWWS